MTVNPQWFISRLNVDEQGELGRHVDDNTMAWWSRQKKEIQDEAFGDLTNKCNGGNKTN